mgnify:FL=1
MAMPVNRERCKQIISLAGHSKLARCKGNVEASVKTLNVSGREVFQVKTTCSDCGSCQERLCVPIDYEISKVME